MVSLIFLVFSSAMGLADGDSPDRMLVDARAAVAQIDPLSDNRQLVLLPALEFSIEIEPICGAAARAESISVSAADTRRFYALDGRDELSVVAATVLIPRQQLGPIRIGNFCRSTATNADEATELTVQGALTAHLSLRCVGDEKESITYVSQPLDIILRCNRPDDAAAIESPEIQESSAESEPSL